MKFLKENYRTILRLLLVVLVALLVVFSFFFSIDLFEHDCCGDHCPVCNFIFVCRTAFRIPLFGSAALLCCQFFAYAFKKLLCRTFSRPAVSPVCLCVRMND